MRIALVVAVAASCLSSPAAAQSTPSRWGAHLDFEAKPGTKRSLGEADLFVPLWQDGRNLVFGNLRGRFDDGDGREGNLGLGLRRMVESGWNLGGYAYFDRRKSENSFYYSQATFGGEALGRDWDVRANAYLPQGERVHDLGTASTASVSAATVVVSSVTTQERALKGFDVEAGWRVPLFAVDEPRQLRLYAGGYRFKDDVADVSGPRVRVELTMAQTPWLWQGAQLVASVEAQDDDVRGSQTFLSLRLRVPLGGKESPRALNWQERRMMAPVVRDVDIVAPVVARAPVLETATAIANGGSLVILDSGTTTGAALPGAVAAAGAGSTVVLTGTYNTTATTQLQNGQTLMGAGALQVRTPSGHVATLTTPGATINANIPSGQFDKAFTVEMATNSTLRGITVTHFNTSGHGATAVRAVGVSNVQIVGNTLSASSSGATALLAPIAAEGIFIGAGSTNIVVSNNVISVTGTTVQNLAGINASPSGFGTVNLLNNTITVSGSGITNAGISTAGGVPGGTIATIAGNTVSATGGTTNNRAFSVVTTAVTAGSNGNVRVAGACEFFGGTSGSIGFADGTSCP